MKRTRATPPQAPRWLLLESVQTAYLFADFHHPVSLPSSTAGKPEGPKQPAAPGSVPCASGRSRLGGAWGPEFTAAGTRLHLPSRDVGSLSRSRRSPVPHDYRAAPALAASPPRAAQEPEAPPPGDPTWLLTSQVLAGRRGLMVAPKTSGPNPQNLETTPFGNRVFAGGLTLRILRQEMLLDDLGGPRTPSQVSL